MSVYNLLDECEGKTRVEKEKKEKIMHIMPRALFAFFCCVSSTLAQAETKRERLNSMTREMLAPVVSVMLTGTAHASAVVIYSKNVPCATDLPPLCSDSMAESEVHTYALTAHHVAEEFLSQKLFPMMPQSPRVRFPQQLPMQAGVWSYGEGVTSGKKRVFTARIVAEDKADDLALIRIDTSAGALSNTARLAPVGTEPLLNDTAWAAGGANGLKPHLKAGLFGHTHERGDHAEIERTLSMSTAPVFFGDSGGGLYHYSEERNRYELVGAISSFLSVPHQSFSTPLPRIYAFLEESGFGFILEAQKSAP